MRTEKKLLDKEALRTIKGGWGFTLPATITTATSTGADPASNDEEGTPSGEPVEDESVIDLGGNPTATSAPPSLFKMGF